DGSWQNEATMDGKGSALVSIGADFRLRETKARDGCSVISRGDWNLCQQKHSDGASLREKKALLDYPLMINQPEIRSKRLLELSTMSNSSTFGVKLAAPVVATWNIRSKKSADDDLHYDLFHITDTVISSFFPARFGTDVSSSHYS